MMSKEAFEELKRDYLRMREEMRARYTGGSTPPMYSPAKPNETASTYETVAK